MMVDVIIPSYPNLYYESKHVRFSNMIVCGCDCDCDCSVKTKEDICVGCQINDHAYPVYIRFLRVHKEVLTVKLNRIRRIAGSISLIADHDSCLKAIKEIDEVLDE